MGIYVDTLEVPEHCNQCFFKNKWHAECIITHTTWTFALKGRLPNCPLKSINLRSENDERTEKNGINC